MGEETLYCELCKLNFATKEELSEHDWSLLHHRKLDKEKGRDILHTCKLCKEDIFGLLAFTKHIHSEKHLNEVTKLKYSESQVVSFDSTPIQESSEITNASATVQTSSETIPLPAAHFLPKAHYFQSLESPLSTTPLLDTVAKNFQLKPGKPYRFTPQHRPYTPPRPNFRPRFQNPYRYVNPNLQSSSNTSGNTSEHSMYPKSVSHITSTSAYTMNPAASNAMYPNTMNKPMSKHVPFNNTPISTYQPPVIQPNASYPNPPTSKYTKQSNPKSSIPNPKGITNPFAHAAAKKVTTNTVSNNYLNISPVPSMNDAYITNRINLLKTKYPVSTANSSNKQQASISDRSPSNTNSGDNLNNISPLSKKQKLERYMKKNEIRLKSKKRALMRQNFSRRSNGHQNFMQNVSGDNNGSSLNSSFSSLNGEDSSSVSIQARKDSFLKPKAIRQSSLKEPSHKNNTIQDNLNLNVQFVLKKGREIMNKYNKGVNKGTGDRYQNAKQNNENSEQSKLSDEKQTSCNSSIDFTSHFKDICKISIPIVSSHISNSNVKNNNVSHLDNRRTQMLSEKAQMLLQKTKPVRVELSALSPSALSSVRKPKKVGSGPLWKSAMEQVKFQQKHSKYIRKAVKEALRGQNAEKKTVVDISSTSNTSKTVLSSSFGGRNSDCSFKSTGSYNSLQSSLSSLYENSDLQASHTSTKISVSAGSNADANPAPKDQKGAQNSSPNFINTDVPFDMEKVVNELLSKSPGFEYLANEHTKRRKIKKKKVKSSGGKKLQAVNQAILGKSETDRLMKKFEQYQKERERCKENAVPAGTINHATGNDKTTTPIERSSDVSVVKRRFWQPVSTGNIDKVTESTASSESKIASVEVNKNVVNGDTSNSADITPEFKLERQSSKHAENTSVDTEKKIGPVKVKSRFIIQNNDSVSSDEQPTHPEQTVAGLKERKKELITDTSVDMEVVFGDVGLSTEKRHDTAKVKKRFIQTTTSSCSFENLSVASPSDINTENIDTEDVSGVCVQSGGTQPSTERTNEIAKIKKRFKQVTSSINIENLSVASEEVNEDSQESNENDLSGNTSKDIESLSMEDDHTRNTAEELASLRERVIKVRNRFRRSSSSGGENLTHQSVIINNQQEKKDAEKDSNISEVISLDDEEDVDEAADNIKKVANQADKQTEAAIKLPETTRPKDIELKIKFRFQNRNKPATVNGTHSPSKNGIQIFQNGPSTICRPGVLQDGHSKKSVSHNSTHVRAPTILVVGHTDTGKEELLNKIRFKQSNLPDVEAATTIKMSGFNIPISKICELTKMVKEFQDFKLMLPGLLVYHTSGPKFLSNPLARGSSLCDLAILVMDIMHGLDTQTIEYITLLQKKQISFIVALNNIDQISEWKKSPHTQVEETIALQNKMTAHEFERRVNTVIEKFAEQTLNAVLHFKNPGTKNYVSLVPTSAHTGDGIGDLMALVCKHSQNLLSNKMSSTKEPVKETNYGESTAKSTAKSTAESTAKPECTSSSSSNIESSERALKVKNRFKQTTATSTLGNMLSSNDSTIDTEKTDVGNEKDVDICEKNKSRSVQRSLSESEASQATDGDSFQRLISNYVYDSEIENVQGSNDQPTSIPAAVIISEEEKPNLLHHCEFKKNNGAFCEAATTERFCDYHLRVLKAVELFISKRVASGPPKVSDAVSLIVSTDDNIEKADLEGECNTPDKVPTSKRRLSENSNDSEGDNNISESDKSIDLSTSRFRRKKCKSVCLQSEESDTSHPHIDLSVSSLAKKVGKQSRFKYLRNLTTCQSEVHKSNLPPTVRKLLDKKHNGFAIVPSVRMRSTSQSESESGDSVNHDKRKEKNTSHQLAKVSSSIVDTTGDVDDDVSEICLSEPTSGKTQSQVSSLHDSDISDLSLLHRLVETIQPSHKNKNTSQNIDPLTTPDANVLEKLFSIQAPVFSKTLSPTTVASNSDSVSNILFNLNSSTNSSDNAQCNMQVTATKSLPVNVITSVMPSPTSVISVVNKPLPSSIIGVSMTSATTMKALPVTTITTTSMASPTSEMPVAITKSLSVSVITRPSETPTQSLATSVIVTPSGTSSNLVIATPCIAVVPSESEPTMEDFSSLRCTPLEHESSVTSVTIVPDCVPVALSTICVTPSAQFQNTIKTPCMISSVLSSTSVLKSKCTKDTECDEEMTHVSIQPLSTASHQPVIAIPLPVCKLATTSSATEPLDTNNEICIGASLESDVVTSSGDNVRKPELLCNEHKVTTITTVRRPPSDDFITHESEFINCIKNRDARLATKRFSEKNDIVNGGKDYTSTNDSTNITTNCYNVPVISSAINLPTESPHLDAETITTLFSFKAPVISNPSNKIVGDISTAVNASVVSNDTSSVTTSQYTTTIILPPVNGVNACSNVISVTDDDISNTSQAISVDLTNEKESSSSSSTSSDENMQSARNDTLPNSVDLESNTWLSKQPSINGEEEISNNHCSPDSLRKDSSHIDIGNFRQSTLMESQINENGMLTPDGIPFSEELSCIDKTESQFHSVKSNLDTAECSETSCDEYLEDAYSTTEDFMSLESDDPSVSQNEIEPPIKDGDADAPSVITNISNMLHDSINEQFDSSYNENNTEDTTVFELEKELNKLQTDEDDALDKLSQANKSLERLKVVMGNLQDEISLHANKMQKISAEKKKLRVKLQEWRTLRENTVNRSPLRKFISKGHSFNGIIRHRKYYSSSNEIRDTSSDDNLPLSFIKDKKLLENISKDENVRLVKTIYVNDSCVSSSKASSTSDNSMSDNNTESDHGSGYDTAPSSPEKNNYDIEKKDKTDQSSNSSPPSSKSNKKPERRSSLRCQGVDISSKGRPIRNKSKRKK